MFNRLRRRVTHRPHEQEAVPGPAGAPPATTEPIPCPDTAKALGRGREVTHWVWDYPFELPLQQGILTCAACGARRDWLLLLHLATDEVSVRCRCTHQWVELQIPADWYRRHTGRICGYFTDAHHRDKSLGFDGTFAGIYW
ncbi:hypothetical protein [Streptomyces triticirhizae]|uniref:Uncharacterized protein n=1 Tax=Streptomyces triticirhizae TaxID=2483353 RepID=A0A3M2MB86_9ACTN|nr:hypothetical protein [Streptomyces triticirhizae]RMI46736.1 hypothetical protein EBN88_00445 [Streptomyces triticirhizae]